MNIQIIISGKCESWVWQKWNVCSWRFADTHCSYKWVYSSFSNYSTYNVCTYSIVIINECTLQEQHHRVYFSFSNYYTYNVYIHSIVVINKYTLQEHHHSYKWITVKCNNKYIIIHT